MGALIACCWLVACASAAPLDDSRVAQILRNDNENIGVDGYKFAFETSDGTQRDEEGVIKNAGTDAEALSVRGSISWVAPDGQTYTITFVADENGYQPQGAHLPK